MPTDDDDPKTLSDDDLNAATGGRKALKAVAQPGPVGMFPPGVGDLKPVRPSPVPTPYPSVPNTKD